MDLLHKWCIKRNSKNKSNYLAIWLVFITILIMVDISVSKEGSVFLFHSKELDTVGIVSDNGTISKEEPVRVLAVRKFHINNNLISNIMDDNDNFSYKNLQENECIFYINFIKYNIIIFAYMAIIFLGCAIIFYLEKILKYIQKNDGKKENHSKLQLLIIL